ncbi:MAG TPA: hypothetical protein VH253_04125 [Phycisphaerae bacterium]|nr:hypothetical protein [Phycisphaerae bacterium]
MEFLQSTAGAESDAGLAAFLEKSRQAWVGMMRDKALVTFDQHEQRAVDEGRLLARLLLEARLARNPAARPAEHDQRPCCPKCGLPGAPVAPAHADLPERALQSRIGKVRFAREQWKCTTCRVVFFPSGPASGTGDRRVQSGGHPPGGA